MRSEVASALTLANQHIHEMSPPSAELWRELVVIRHLSDEPYFTIIRDVKA